MSAYRFMRATANGAVLDQQTRDLSDDAAATDWMRAEFLNPGEHLEAFRGEDANPFARREFGERVVLG